MYYYIMPKIGKGTDLDPYRPDIDVGTSFVGNVGTDNFYIIATPTLQTAKSGRTQLPPFQALQNACTSRGINFNDVMNKWFVGGS
jgi:hypothetical protein